MYYAYILHSERHPDRRYVGFTRDLKGRLADHSTGKNPSTQHGRPWHLTFYAAFEQKDDALEFERYLKT